MEPPGKIRFLRYCYEELSPNTQRDSIGLLTEKRLHRVLKRWITDDPSAQEQKIRANDGSRSRAVADLLTPSGEIFEIQTGSLYPLRKKTEFYLTRTEYRLTIVHPLAAQKTVIWIDPTSGEITAKNKSPKKETPLSALGELYALREYLKDPRLSVWFPMLAVEEYRLLNGWSKNKKRGSERYEIIPTDLLGTAVLRGKSDFAALLPEGLPPCFTAAEFAKHAHMRRGIGLYGTLAVLCEENILEKGEKSGRSYLYRIK